MSAEKQQAPVGGQGPDGVVTTSPSCPRCPEGVPIKGQKGVGAESSGLEPRHGRRADLRSLGGRAGCISSSAKAGDFASQGLCQGRGPKVSLSDSGIWPEITEVRSSPLDRFWVRASAGQTLASTIDRQNVTVRHRPQESDFSSSNRAQQPPSLAKQFARHQGVASTERAVGSVCEGSPTLSLKRPCGATPWSIHLPPEQTEPCFSIDPLEEEIAAISSDYHGYFRLHFT